MVSAPDGGASMRGTLEGVLRKRTARRAYDFVRSIEVAAIFNHSVRTFVYASAVSTRTGDVADIEALFAACIFHDAGTAPGNDGPERFEVEGADAASRFLAGQGWNHARIADVWDAIALHTSAGIAERRGGITRLTRLGVRIDFGASDLVAPELIRAMEHDWSRLDIERVLSDAVVKQTLTQPGKAPRASWPGALREAYLADPDAEGLNPAF